MVEKRDRICSIEPFLVRDERNETLRFIERRAIKNEGSFGELWEGCDGAGDSTGKGYSGNICGAFEVYGGTVVWEGGG